ncbi:hypothetical protein ENBRE01_1073 [Enteropsectra breve]|nr:hypothetical protein ENBRE01_1073 [Enteropsectra breve]
MILVGNSVFFLRAIVFAGVFTALVACHNPPTENIREVATSQVKSIFELLNAVPFFREYMKNGSWNDIQPLHLFLQKASQSENRVQEECFYKIYSICMARNKNISSLENLIETFTNAVEEENEKTTVFRVTLNLAEEKNNRFDVGRTVFRNNFSNYHLQDIDTYDIVNNTLKDLMKDSYKHNPQVWKGFVLEDALRPKMLFLPKIIIFKAYIPPTEQRNDLNFTENFTTYHITQNNTKINLKEYVLRSMMIERESDDYEIIEFLKNENIADKKEKLFGSGKNKVVYALYEKID